MCQKVSDQFHWLKSRHQDLQSSLKQTKYSFNSQFVSFEVSHLLSGVHSLSCDSLNGVITNILCCVRSDLVSSVERDSNWQSVVSHVNGNFDETQQQIEESTQKLLLKINASEMTAIANDVTNCLSGKYCVSLLIVIQTVYLLTRVMFNKIFSVQLNKKFIYNRSCPKSTGILTKLSKKLKNQHKNSSAN